MLLFFFSLDTGVTISRAHVKTSSSLKITSNPLRLFPGEHWRWIQQLHRPKCINNVFTAWEAHHICTLSGRSKVLRTLVICVPKSETPSIAACRLMQSYSSDVAYNQLTQIATSRFVFSEPSREYTRESPLGMPRVLAIWLHQSRVDSRV